MLGSALLLLGVLVFELVPRDEARIERRLNDLCTTLNQTHDEASLSRLRETLSAALSPEVHLRAPELGQDLIGAGAVSRRARQLLELPPLSFAWSSLEIHVLAERARVDADLWITERGAGEQHRDLRRSRLTLRKVGSAWQLDSIAVERASPSEPEARP